MAVISKNDLPLLPRDGVDGEYTTKVNVEGDMVALTEMLSDYDKAGQSAPLENIDDYWLDKWDVVCLYGPKNKSKELITKFHKSGRAFKFDWYDIVLTDTGFYLFCQMKVGIDGDINEPLGFWDYYPTQVMNRAEHITEGVSEALGSPQEVVEGMKSLGKIAVVIVAAGFALQWAGPAIINSLSKGVRA